MFSVVNFNFGNNNNNKIKKIYNKGDIILVRPQNMRYPYKILSIKEKKLNLEDNIKILKVPNHKKLFTLSDICSISNFGTPAHKYNTNQLNNSTVKENYNVLYNFSQKLKKNNSDIAIRKKIMDLERQKKLNNKKNLKNKMRQRNLEDNLFLQQRGLSFNRSKDLKIIINSNIKEDNSHFLNYDSTMINNEKNKICYKIKYNDLVSSVILSDSNEKNLIFKRNFDNIKNIRQIKNQKDKSIIKGLKIIKSNKDIKLKRLKSSKNEKTKPQEKIIYKITRPFSSENRRKNQKINFELKSINKKNKFEENKNYIEKGNKFRKYKKKLKIEKELRSIELKNGYLNCNNDVSDNNFDEISRYTGFKSRKNYDIFDYIGIPEKSKDIYENTKKEINKDFTEFKSVLNKKQIFFENVKG